MKALEEVDEAVLEDVRARVEAAMKRLIPVHGTAATRESLVHEAMGSMVKEGDIAQGGHAIATTTMASYLLDTEKYELQTNSSRQRALTDGILKSLAPDEEMRGILGLRQIINARTEGERKALRKLVQSPPGGPTKDKTLRGLFKGNQEAPDEF